MKKYKSRKIISAIALGIYIGLLIQFAILLNQLTHKSYTKIPEKHIEVPENYTEDSLLPTNSPNIIEEMETINLDPSYDDEIETLHKIVEEEVKMLENRFGVTTTHQ